MSLKIHAIVMPKWGMEMSEGDVVNWHFAVGEHVAEGDDLVDIETSKIVNTLQSHSAGELRRVLAQEGDTYDVGNLLGVIAAGAVSDQEIDDFVSSYEQDGVVEEPAAESKTDTAPAAIKPDSESENKVEAKTQNGSEIKVSVVARRLARKHSVDLSALNGTGIHGRISKKDVESVIQVNNENTSRPSTQQVSAGPSRNAVSKMKIDPNAELIKVAGMRKTIAQRLQASKQKAPHFRVVADVDMAALEALREKLNTSASEAKISVNDLLIKACAKTLIACPDVNIQFDGDVIQRFDHADISVAVALDGGLITPVVKNVNNLPLAEISSQVKDLANRAKTGKLNASEFIGGTFTISNLGMFGVKHFDAIINPPQAAILAVGATQSRPVVENNQLAIGRVMTLTLSSDHRVIDGALAATFLQQLKETLESPEALASN